MNWKEDIGIESIDCEYKVFNFNPLILPVEDGIKYLSSGIFCFNDSVDKTLINYIKMYLPKYLCSFFNPKSKLTKAHLYFGINDDGKVIGIPYIGQIQEDFINHEIDKIFSSYIKFPSSQVKNKIRQKIKIEIIPVNKSQIKHTNKKSLYSKYVDNLNKLEIQNEIYKKKINNWYMMCDPNNLKLYDMINNLETRKYIWKYTKIKSNYMKKKFVNKYSHLEPYCDVPTYWDLMSDVKTNKKFKPLELGTMYEVSKNNLDVYRWTAVWKDSKISTLKLAKPKKPIKKINEYYPIFLLSQVSKMIPEWIKKNKDLDLWIIKITFDIGNQWQNLEFLDNEKQWKTTYRTIIDGNPMSPSFVMYH